MKLLRSTIHPNINNLEGSLFIRKAARAIVLRGENILLLYTQRYDDYTLPGGGINADESNIEGLTRELREETGAHSVRNIREFGLYEEYRPWHKDDFNIVHIKSYCYVCDIDRALLSTNLEDYEVRNGMTPIWKNIRQAITHNEETLATSSQKGISIERETFLLKLIVEELL